MRNIFIDGDKLCCKIAGHSNYHGDRILCAIRVMQEGKEPKDIEPLENMKKIERGEWLFVADRRERWKVNVICSSCKTAVDKEYKYGNEKHQEDFKKENPYCCKCGAKMG